MTGSLSRRLVAVALRGICFAAIPALVLPAILSKGVTMDEYVHAPAAAIGLETRSFRANCEQPPVPGLIAAASLRLAGVRIRNVDPFDEEAVGRAYRGFWLSGAMPLEEILLRARAPLIGFSLGMAALVYGWSRTLYGPRGALISLAALAFCPTILAHTGLVTGDLPLAASGLLALLLFRRLCEAPSIRRAALLGASLGFAILCKFSAILIPVGMAAYLMGSSVRDLARMGRSGGGILGRPSPPDGRRTAGWLTIVLLGSAGSVVWAGYLFEIRPLSRDARLPKNERIAGFIRSSPAVEAAYRKAATMPVPAASLIQGIDRVRKHNRHGHPAFFLGERSRRGWWSYFPVAFLLKTSPPFLILVGMAAAAWRSGRPADARSEPILLAAAGAFLIIAMSSRIHIGIRHILPVYPILCILVGRLGTVRLLGGGGGTALLIALLGWHVAEGIRTCPDGLAYFQPVAGGPSRGWRKLVDSNLDWGQDLPALKRRFATMGEEMPYIAYFGPIDPADVGIRYRPLVPGRPVRGLVAISASALQLGITGRGPRPRDEDPYGWIRRYEPFDHVGHSILLFRIE